MIADVSNVIMSSYLHNNLVCVLLKKLKVLFVLFIKDHLLKVTSVLSSGVDMEGDEELPVLLSRFELLLSHNI